LEEPVHHESGTAGRNTTANRTWNGQKKISPWRSHEKFAARQCHIGGGGKKEGLRGFEKSRTHTEKKREEKRVKKKFDEPVEISSVSENRRRVRRKRKNKIRG